jgi:CHAD domain-containing protein
LHTFSPVLEEPWASDLRERLRWLQDALAPVRDADVFSFRMHALTAQLPHADVERAEPLVKTLDTTRREEHEALRKALRDPHYIDLIDELVAAVAGPRFRVDPGTAAAQCTALIVKRVFKRTRKRVRAAGEQPSDRALHRIRIASKHLRYAAESFACVAKKRAPRYARCVETLQETLGIQHDGVVALARLRAFEGPPASRFAAGELAVLASIDGTEACARWRDEWDAIADKRHRFW